MAAIQSKPVGYMLCMPEQKFTGPLPPGLVEYPPRPKENLNDDEITFMLLGIKSYDELEKKEKEIALRLGINKVDDHANKDNSKLSVQDDVDSRSGQISLRFHGNKNDCCQILSDFDYKSPVMYLPRAAPYSSNMSSRQMWKRRNSYSDAGYAVRVTNISEDTREPDLLQLFCPFGVVRSVYLAKDRKTGRNRGFGFVNFVYKEDAQRAINTLNGYGYDFLILRVEWATPKTS